VTSNYPQVGLPVSGYEIHQGRSRLIDSETTDNKSAYQPLFDDPGLGLVDITQSIWGTYLHGLFDNGPWRRAWLNQLRHQRGLASLPTGIPDYREQREVVLNSLADSVEAHLDLSTIIPNLT
ncbi:MAG: cobyric acid synthase CobQ, partial [Coleofasciculus sp. C2-GNP5-27]